MSNETVVNPIAGLRELCTQRSSYLLSEQLLKWIADE